MKTLSDRLDIPDQPVVHDRYERGEDVGVIPPRAKDAEKPQLQVSEAEEESAIDDTVEWG